MQWVRDHVKVASTIIVFVATLVGALGVFVSDLRGWFDNHALIGWLAALIAATVALVVWLRWVGDLESSERTIAHKDAEIADLASRLDPTQRDLNQFSEVLAALPWGSGVLSWLDGAFTAKQWTDTDVDPLYSAHSRWREWFFDDPEVQSAFVALHDAIGSLVVWLSYEGAPVSPDPDLYTIAGGGERDGGWAEFDAAREDALNRVDVLLASRREFERVGRRRRL